MKKRLNLRMTATFVKIGTIDPKHFLHDMSQENFWCDNPFNRSSLLKIIFNFSFLYTSPKLLEIGSSGRVNLELSDNPLYNKVRFLIIKKNNSLS